ncbi:MAG: DNA recombination protein RmuC [Thermodesulfovibrionales bacterium]|nr:DNA recombination protein RmuC [Thermodesulfovibrionales bacterium]
MIEIILIFFAVFMIIWVIYTVLYFKKISLNMIQQIQNNYNLIEKTYERLEKNLKDEIALVRQEVMGHSGQLRLEVINNMTSLSKVQNDQLDLFSNQLFLLTKNIEERLSRMSDKIEEKLKMLLEQTTCNSKDSREELSRSLKSFEDRITFNMKDFNELQTQKFDSLLNIQRGLLQIIDFRLDKIKETIDSKMKEIQQDNSEKLEKIRLTVDEKLYETIDKRLGDSFKIISERLDMVHKGLGEMQFLASSVGDLKKILSNIKARGIWGEMQLEALLEQILTKDQYAKNIVTKKNSAERVEFAIKLPVRNEDNTEIIWLPIDAKFPKEDYEKLLLANENADQPLVDELVKQLEYRVKLSAKNIRDKYLDPPNTTDFAVMFFPVEGLYAEVLRIPGLVDFVQREYRVNIAGPTTMAALLNSLQMGFRTLAIERRSSEVWTLLSAVKSEFGRFGLILEKTLKKLQEASITIEDATKVSRRIEKKLKDVQELPQPQADAILK